MSTCLIIFPTYHLALLLLFFQGNQSYRHYAEKIHPATYNLPKTINVNSRAMPRTLNDKHPDSAMVTLPWFQLYIGVI